jgi:uncharacterized membrane protein HdeD (DUF308 family)
VPSITLLCGTLLIALGAAGYWLQDAENRSLTALIPAAFGVAFLVLGLLATKDNLRKYAMHIAAAVGLIGLVAGLERLLRKAFGGDFTLDLRTKCISLLVLICAVFVGLCVNSFVQARRRGAQNESEKV